MVPGFDEIIFENRNRSYGAYDLRKRYRSAAGLSLFGGVTIFSVPIILSFIFSPEPATAISEPGIYVVVKPDNLIDPNKIAQPVPVKPAPVPPLWISLPSTCRVRLGSVAPMATAPPEVILILSF